MKGLMSGLQLFRLLERIENNSIGKKVCKGGIYIKSSSWSIKKNVGLI